MTAPTHHPMTAHPAPTRPVLSILPGDCRETLATLSAESVQCVVTSPPYYGLRDYGTGTWTGGSADCDHRQSNLRPDHSGAQGLGTKGNQSSSANSATPYRDTCGKCGAARQDKQIGLEQTPEAFVAEMVTVFREVRRVLKTDGTLWLNLGDSYANDSKWGGSTGGKHASGNHGQTGIGRQRNVTGLPGKNLIGIPWMVAFALRADGWILRQDIIWAKPNPMPESVTDRCTKAHEYLFLLTKSPCYYYDADVIAERSVEFSKTPNRQRVDLSQRKGFTDERIDGVSQCGVAETRNKRSVWTVATKPYSEAHFATFPPALVRPCILAGTRPGDTTLDPFGGSGTVGMVALELGRSAVLCELNPAYCDLIRQRCDVTPGLALDNPACATALTAHDPTLF